MSASNRCNVLALESLTIRSGMERSELPVKMLSAVRAERSFGSDDIGVRGVS